MIPSNTDRRLASTDESQEPIEAKIARLEAELGLADVPGANTPEAETPEQKLQKGQSFMDDFKQSSMDMILPPTVRSMGRFGKGLAKGAVKFAEDLGNTAIDTANWVDDFLAKKGVGADDPDWSRLGFAPETSNSFDEKAGFFIGRYLTPLGGAGMGLKALQMGKAAKAGTAVVGSAALSAVTVDPDDKNLSDLLNSVPELEAVIPDFLTSDPDDSMAEKRLKNFAEALFVDAATMGLAEGIVKGTNVYRKSRHLKKAKMVEDEVSTLVKAKEAEVPATKVAGQEAPAKPQIDPKEVETVIAKKISPEQEAIIKKADELLNPQIAEGLSRVPVQNADELVDVLKYVDEPAFSETFSAMKRGERTIEQVTGEANVIFNDQKQLQKLINRDPGVPLKDSELVALKMASQEEFLKLQKVLPKDGKFKDIAEQAAFLNQYRRFAHISSSSAAGVSESARNMRFFQEVYTGTKDPLKKAELLEEYTKIVGQDAEMVANFTKKVMESGRTADEVAETLAKKGRFQKSADIMYEMWYNGILSGPGTHLVNAMSNATVMAVAPIETLISSGLSRNEAIYAQEAGAMIQGYMASFREAFSTAKDLMMKETIPPGISIKIPEVRDRAIKSDMDNWFGSVINTTGKVINLPTRALHASDAFFRIMNSRARSHQLAMRELISSGKPPGSEGFNELYQKFIKNPPSDISAAVNTYSDKQTFTSAMSDVIGGDLYNNVLQISEKVPLGRAIIPFVRITANLNNYTLERMPLINLVSDKVGRELKAGGARRAEALGKMTLGGGLMSIGAYMAASESMKGGTNKNYAAERALKNPNMPLKDSIKIGDQWVSIERMAPFSTIIGMGADIAEMATYLDNDSQEKLEDLAAAGMAIIADRLTPEFLTESMPKFFDFLQDAQAGKIRPETFPDAIGEFMASMIPTRAFKSVMSDEDIKDLNTNPNKFWGTRIWERAKNQWMADLGFADGLPTQMNIFGEEITRPTALGPDSMSPFFTNEKKEDFVTGELRRLGLHAPVFNPEPKPGEEHLRIKMPDRYIRTTAGGKTDTIRLSPKQYAKLVKLSAGIGLEGMPPLKDSLNVVLKDPTLTDEMKKYQIKKTIGAYRTMAKKMLQYESKGLTEKVQQLKIDRANALFGPTPDGFDAEDVEE